MKPTAMNKPKPNLTAVQLILQWIQSNSFNIESQSGGKHVVIDVDDIKSNFNNWLMIERQQHGNTWDAAIETNEDRGGVIARSMTDFDEYQIK